jgi:putative mRNA 3-end processing factor
MNADDLIVLTERGLYCKEGDFYIDPWKPVPYALVTHGHSDHAHFGSEKYLVQKSSLGIMKLRLGFNSEIETIPYGEKKRIGNVDVSFHPAGHILGSSQIRVQKDEQVWVFTGDYKRDPDPSCEPFEVVECDTLITEATFALPIYRWKPTSMVARDIYKWWMQNRERGWNSILCCYALGKAQRVLAELANLPELANTEEHPVYLHGAMERMIQVYRDAGIKMLPTLRTANLGKEKLKGQLILAPPSASGSTWTRKFEPYEVGFASGWMLIRGNRRRKAYDRGFVISDHSDWPSLLQTIRESKATRIIATHGDSETLSRYVQEEMGLIGEKLKTQYGIDEENEGEEGMEENTGDRTPSEQPKSLIAEKKPRVRKAMKLKAPENEVLK